MGVYEIITGITKNEENLKVEIRQTEGTLERNLVYIKNTKTNRAYLKKQIRASINKKEYKEDDSHIDLKNTTDNELDAIEICFREKED